MNGFNRACPSGNLMVHAQDNMTDGNDDNDEVYKCKWCLKEITEKDNGECKECKESNMIDYDISTEPINDSPIVPLWAANIISMAIAILFFIFIGWMFAVAIGGF